MNECDSIHWLKNQHKKDHTQNQSFLNEFLYNGFEYF